MKESSLRAMGQGTIGGLLGYFSVAIVFAVMNAVSYRANPALRAREAW